MRFHVRIPYPKQLNVEKHTPARARPLQSVSKGFGMELASLVWDSYSWTYYLLCFVCQFHAKSCLDGVNTSVLTKMIGFGMELVHEV